MINVFIFISILFSINCLAQISNIELVYPTQMGVHKVNIEIKNEVFLNKKSNYFDNKRLRPVGEFKLQKSVVANELKDLESIKSKMENISNHLAKFNKAVKDIMPKPLEREGYIKIDGHIISEQSSYYKLVRNRLEKIINHHLLKPVETFTIDFGKSESITLKNGKESREYIRLANTCERMNNEFFCQIDQGVFYHKL